MPRKYPEQKRLVSLAGELSEKGLALFGGMAVQHYLPREFHSLHDDLDMLAKPKDLAQLMHDRHVDSNLRKIGPSHYETRLPHGEIIHLELSETMPSTSFQVLNHSTDQKEAIRVSIPEPEYLMARLIHVISRPETDWPRRLKQLHYLCRLTTHSLEKIRKPKVMRYLHGLSGGKKNTAETRKLLSQVLENTPAKELATHAKETRGKAGESDYAKALEQVRNQYGLPSPARNSLVTLSAALHSLSNRDKRALASALNTTENEADLFGRITEESRKASSYEINLAAQRNPEKLLFDLAGIPKTKRAPKKHDLSVPREFVISDTHFDHANIIKYCNRPFNDTGHMNKIILRKWNRTVKPEDIVYFLGDLAMGKGNTAKWLARLNGKKIFIKGDHDEEVEGQEMHKHLQIVHDGVSLLLVHDPDKAPKDWHGWVLHGHHHNNHLEGYPRMHARNRTVNASVELHDYRPVLLSRITDDIKKHTRR